MVGCGSGNHSRANGCSLGTGSTVVNSTKVPALVRQAINVESGLNDGICLPVLLLFLSLAGQGAQSDNATYWLGFTSQQVGFGAIVGIAIGYCGSKLITQSCKRQWMTQSFEDLSILGLSILAYAGAELVGGNGFIATFVAGLTLGSVVTDSVSRTLQEFGEAEGQLLTLISFLLFGAVMVMPSIKQATWQIWLYGIVSLTIVRPISVAIATKNCKLQWDSTLFIGWFGPRGIASIVYGLLIVEKESLASSELIFATMVITVLMSIFAHGFTAFPGVHWYGNRLSNKKHQDRMPEMQPVAETPSRLPWRN